jgi:hypothetical protein
MFSERTEVLKWANPDKDHLRKLMRYVFTNREEAKLVYYSILHTFLLFTCEFLTALLIYSN